VPAADAAAVSDAEAQALFGAYSDFPVLLLAVSGGPDSTALMWLAARWCKSCAHPPKLIAVTVDHGLRPEAKREAEAVKRLARSLGIEHHTLRWTGSKPKTGLQEAARLARYRLLLQAAKKAGANHILTAHTLDDQAETVLFRIGRGSGVSGLSGMSPVGALPVAEGQGIFLARPLLEIPKARLIATLRKAKVPYSEDPSNRDPRFARPRLRTLLPTLAGEGVTAERLGLLARRVQRAEAALVAVVNAAEDRLAPDDWPERGPVTLPAEEFSNLPDEIGLRLLGRVIAATGDEGPVELGKLEAMYEALFEAIGTAGRFRRTLAGALVMLRGGEIVIERAPPRRGRAAKRP
jgi:tRNA(Ile)-lysidine synthase